MLQESTTGAWPEKVHGIIFSGQSLLLFFPKALKEKNQTELLIKDQHCKMMFTSIIFYD